MGKPITLILMVLAILLAAFNFTLVNFEAPFVGDSLIALIGIAASLCAIVLLLIFVTSKKIQDKMNNN